MNKSTHLNASDVIFCDPRQMCELQQIANANQSSTEKWTRKASRSISVSLS